MDKAIDDEFTYRVKWVVAQPHLNTPRDVEWVYLQTGGDRIDQHLHCGEQRSALSNSCGGFRSARGSELVGVLVGGQVLGDRIVVTEQEQRRVREPTIGRNQPQSRQQPVVGQLREMILACASQ